MSKKAWVAFIAAEIVFWAFMLWATATIAGVITDAEKKTQAQEKSQWSGRLAPCDDKSLFVGYEVKEGVWVFYECRVDSSSEADFSGALGIE